MQVPIPYPSAILIREKAICVSLEHIRMVVGTNEVRGCLRERERARPPAALPVHEPARGAVENSYRTSCTSTRCKRALGSVRQQCASRPMYGMDYHPLQTGGRLGAPAWPPSVSPSAGNDSTPARTRRRRRCTC